LRSYRRIRPYCVRFGFSRSSWIISDLGDVPRLSGFAMSSTVESSASVTDAFVGSDGSMSSR
jgi:hypothetical protein